MELQTSLSPPNSIPLKYRPTRTFWLITLPLPSPQLLQGNSVPCWEWARTPHCSWWWMLDLRQCPRWLRCAMSWTVANVIQEKRCGVWWRSCWFVIACAVVFNLIKVEVQLSRQHRFHTLFVCPVSREQTNEDNPPMMLLCGHIVSRDSMSRLVKGIKPGQPLPTVSASPNAKFKCPYCPSENIISQAIQVNF